MKLEDIQGWKNVNLLKRQAYALKIYLVRQYSRLVSPSKVIAVAGTLGKTTTVAFLESILSLKMNLPKTQVKGLQTSLDSFLDLSDLVFKIGPKVQKALVELDPKNVKEVDGLKQFIRYNCLLITQFSDLKENFPDTSDKVAEALEELVRLLPVSGTLILNWEDSQVRRFADKFIGEGIVFFGFDEKNCHVWASNLRIENLQTVFELNYGVERVEVRSNLLGFHQVISALAAAAAAINLGFSLISVKKGIERVESLPGRMQVINGLNNSIIVDDTYDGEIKGFMEALQTINLIPARRRIIVLGEMSADIKASERAHTSIAREIYSNKIDLVLLGSGQAKYVEEELTKLGFIRERMMSGLQNPGIVSNLIKILGKGDVVLIKGHPNLKYSEVVKKITKSKR